MPIRPTTVTIYFLSNGDSPAHGYNKKSHEYYETCEQVLRPGHDCWEERDTAAFLSKMVVIGAREEVNKVRNRTLILIIADTAATIVELKKE